MSDKKPTFEESVWKWMRRENRPVTTAEVKARFKTSRQRVSMALWRLVERKGAAIRVGSGRGCRYLATRWCPYDQRGMSPNTYAALRRHSFPAFDTYWPKSKLNPINNGGRSAYVGR